MSGETERHISGWTTDTLHEHVSDQLADLRLNLRERFEAQTKAVEVGFTAQTTAMDAALRAQEKAVDTALVAQEKATATAFLAADKAVDKALDAAEKGVDQRASTLDREFHEHLEQVRHENALAFVNSDKAIQAAFASSNAAISKAEAAADKRFEAVNEFRGQLADQAATFISRVEAEARFHAGSEKSDDGIGRNAERIAMLELAMQKVPTQTEKDAAHATLAAAIAAVGDRVGKIELAAGTIHGKGEGLNAAWLYALAAIAALGTIISMYVAVHR